MSESIKVLAELLKTARKKKNLTQKEVCEKSSIVLRTYQRIESGELSPKLETLSQISIALGSDFLQDYFHYLENNKDSNNTQIPKTAEEFRQTLGQQADMPMVVTCDEVAGIKKVFENDLNTDTSQQGYWEWNVSTNHFFWSPKVFEIYEIEPTDPNPNETLYSKIADEQLEKIHSSLNNLVEKGIPYNNTHQFSSDGKILWARGQARRYKNENGELIVFGVVERLIR